MEVDFNLDNYDLQDLLNLFNLNYNFTNDDFKISKKLVMQMHPDKSGLDKKYFLFYCKALRIVKNIYDFKNKKHNNLDNNNKNIEYLTGNDEDTGKKLLVENLLKKDNEFFHEWFNKTFDQINIVDDERKEGYGDWFKSDEDIDVIENITQNKLHEKIQAKKNHLSTLIKIEDIQSINSDNSKSYQNLGGSIPSSYSSDIFSNLQYEDLKKAHTETVVPIGDDDYNKILKFNNVENLRQYRQKQNIKPMNENDAGEYFNNINNKTEETSVQLAYKLAKQDEQMEFANKNWWNSMTLLK